MQQIKEKKIKTDLDLSKEFGDHVYDDYKTALEFTTANPDYSLMKFREIISALCREIADSKKIKLKGDSTCQHIKQLFFEQIIHKPLSDNLHAARIFGNKGVHKENTEEVGEEFIKTRTESLSKKANAARKLIVQILEDTFYILKNEYPPKVTLAETGAQEYRNILFEAAITESSHDKLKAGVVYESIANDLTIKSSSNMISNETDYHFKSLLRLAAIQYEASYKISARVNLKKNNLTMFTAHLVDDEVITKYCDAEPLYNYAVIAHEGHLGNEFISEGVKLIQILAEREYSRAQAYYGAHLYDTNQFWQAKNYLDRAAEKDDTLALRVLFYYFTEEKINELDMDLALKNLHRGVDLGCPDCIATLGEVYHKGLGVDKDDIKAEEYLKKSIENGSYIGKRYYQFFFKTTPEEIGNEFQKELLSLSKLLKKETDTIKLRHELATKNPKIGRNEICPCGSGKKYKYCCLNQTIR